MLVTALCDLLESNGVSYATYEHEPSFTAQETAAVAHIAGRRLAKTVIARLDGKLAMVVVPAPHRVDLETLREQTGAHRVELAHEDDFKEAFPECELGAMPPFGNLYGMDVFVEKDLAENETIAFNAGGHDELMSVAYKDFARLTHPTLFGNAE